MEENADLCTGSFPAMTSATAFSTLRARMAPLIRPLLVGCPPLRWAAMWWLGRRQPGEVEVDGLRFAVNGNPLPGREEVLTAGKYAFIKHSSPLQEKILLTSWKVY